jgi:hypothetical protein
MSNENKPIDEIKATDVKPETEKPAKKTEDAPFEPEHYSRGFAVAVISIFLAMLILPTLA